jgi:hypothetical protein
MAFVPMVSASPPPMIPDDIEDLEDTDEFNNGLEDEDEDSSSFDLTGLSEKLHSIPKETIFVAPREVRNDPDPLIMITNGFLDFRNQVPPDGKSDHGDQDDVQAEKQTKADSIGIKGDDKENNKKDSDEEFGDVDTTTPINELPKEPIDQSSDNKPVENNLNEAIKQSEDVHIRDDHQEPGVKTQTFGESVENEKEEQIEICNDDPLVSTETEDKYGESSDEIEISEDQALPVQIESDEDFSDQMQMTDDPQEPVKMESDEDFGDFDAPPPLSDPPEGPIDDEVGDSDAVQVVAEVPPLNLDDDNEDEDDFGDFASEIQQSESSTSAGWASFPSSPREKLDQILVGLQLKLATVISSLYATAESPLTDPDDLERVQPLDFDRDECEDTIWHQIYNIQTTPALNHKCKDGIGRGRMLTVIRIDPKNVIQQDYRPQKPPQSQQQPGNVPAFAAGLGVTLEPVKAEADKDTLLYSKKPTAVEAFEERITKTPGGIKSSSVIQLPSSSLSLLPNEDDFRGPRTKSRTTAAQTILDSFPLLDFMQSPILSPTRSPNQNSCERVGIPKNYS